MTRPHTLAKALLLPAAVALSMGTGSSAQAEDGYLVLNTIALHFKNADERNTFTPGIGWEYSPSSKVGFHVGTLSDSFGYQAAYGGLNYATQPMFADRVRFMLGATILHKQFRQDSEPETKLVPLPAMELGITKKAVLNISGSPQVDIGDQRNNAVVFFQLKLNLS